LFYLKKKNSAYTISFSIPLIGGYFVVAAARMNPFSEIKKVLKL
jgi:hypothetical protein